MLSFATPAWLLGLLLVPAIRWLHRGGPQRRAVPVASLALWRRAETTGPAAGERRPPDPAWRRRALLAALLSLALAGLQSAAPLERVTVWVDDSLSMLTREDGGTRLERGLATVAEAATAQPGVGIEVRALGSPWTAHAGLSADVARAVVAGAGRREPSAPPAGLRRADRQHWLLTDGADAELPLDGYARVFLVGETRRNAGLVRLAARRSLEDREQLDVELEAANGGDADEQRVVTLTDDAGRVERATLRISPGGSASWAVTVPMSQRLEVRLEPRDSLAADDVLALDTRPLAAKRVAADPGCPATVLAALRVHPSLDMAGDAADADLAVDCGAAASAPAIPRIRLVRDGAPRVLDAPLLWSSAVGAEGRRLGAYTWRAAGTLQPVRSDDAVLLAAGATPLIVRRQGGDAPLLETVLDLEPEGAGDRSATPLMVAFLVDQALSGSLLDRVAVAGRDPRSVTVVPRAATAAPGISAAAPATATDTRDRTRPLLIAAVLALLWELAALLLRWRRERADAGAWPR